MCALPLHVDEWPSDLVRKASPLTSWGQRHGRYHFKILPGFNLASRRRLLDRFDDMIPSTSVGAAISALPATRFSQDNTNMHKCKPPTWLNTTSLDMFAAWLSPITHDKCPQPIAGQACQTGCAHPSENWQLLDTTTRAAHRANGCDPPRKMHVDHEATLLFFFIFF